MLRPLLTLAALAACSADPAVLVSPELSPPVTPGFTLSAPASLAPGDSFQLTATLPAGAPGRDVRFFVGLGGLGAGPCAGATCLDITGPLRDLGSHTPSSGSVTLSLTLPATAPTGQYGLQAVQRVGGSWRLSAPLALNVVDAHCGDGQLDPGETCLADQLVGELRADTAGTLLALSRTEGWPVEVEGGLLFATDTPGAWQLAGDHSGWTPAPMTPDAGFSWTIVPAAGAYKFTDGTTWRSDPWSRAYDHDSFGEISLIAPTGAHLERLFQVTDGQVLPRTVRAWIPATVATHVLYVADGQNLFDPGAIWGGWHLQDSVPPGVMLVGIDNTPERFSEYTHVPDLIGGSVHGGEGDAYAAFVHGHVRQRVADTWGEPSTVGLMGSSLGGLISLHIADRYPGAYDFTASLSGTIGWGSIGLNNPTMIDRYAAAGLRDTVIYLDSGGDGSCFDSDGDGIEDDDPNSSDNFCTNNQLRDVLAGAGYTFGVDLHHWWEPGAPHN